VASIPLSQIHQNMQDEDVSPEESGILIQRIQELEEEQDTARKRIEHLTQAKMSVEIALTRLQAQQQKTAHDRLNSERLQAELNNLVKKREQEQEQLKLKIEELKLRARHDIALLKAERDAALAMVEKQMPDNVCEVHAASSKWLEYLAVSLLTGIVLLTLLVLFF
jgi:vacuolar-type H+-ATPase subunit I/STV1